MNTLNNMDSLKGYFTPEIILMLGTILVLLVAFGRENSQSKLAFWLSVTTIFLALIVELFFSPKGTLSLFEGMLAYDAFGHFFKVLILLTALVACLFTEHSYDLKNLPKVEYYSFLVSLTLGLCIMTVANDLLMMYLALEMASIVSYILAGYIAFNKRSEEAGLKYVFYGGMASGVMIFGLSLLYGLTGTLNLIEIREYLLVNPTDLLVLFLTFIFILAGLGYKMAIAPFHMWSPDVYEGAPIAVTAFLSVASKAAGFAMTVRFFAVGFIEINKTGEWIELNALDWQFLVAVLSALTMTIGNLVAIQQTNIKRFLAYSSVAHAGYLLIALAVQSKTGVESILFYFMIYFLMNLGAFLVAILVSGQFGTESLEDYKGMIKRGGFGFVMTLTFSVFLLSLAGLPPFAGFIAKWYVFGALIESGPDLLWLAVIGVLNSVVSLFYYVRIMKFMIFDEPKNQDVILTPHWSLSTLLCGLAGLTVFFGLFFSVLSKFAEVSSQILHS